MSQASNTDAAAKEDLATTEVERNLPGNSAALLAHGLLGQTGFRLVNVPTFLPHFASVLAGSASGSTVMRAMQSLGQFLSPLAAVTVVEHRPHAKRLGVIFGSAMRLQLLFLALVALFVPRPRLALLLVWLFVGLFGLAQGLQGVAFQVVMAKVIPIERRGRLLGLRDLASGIVLIGVAGVGGFLIEHFGFSAGNGYTLLLAFGLTSLGLGAFARVKEPAGRELRAPTPLHKRLRELPALLRAEPDFRRFISASARKRFTQRAAALHRLDRSNTRDDRRSSRDFHHGLRDGSVKQHVGLGLARGSQRLQTGFPALEPAWAGWHLTVACELERVAGIAHLCAGGRRPWRFHARRLEPRARVRQRA